MNLPQPPQPEQEPVPQPEPELAPSAAAWARRARPRARGREAWGPGGGSWGVYITAATQKPWCRSPCVPRYSVKMEREGLQREPYFAASDAFDCSA